MDKEELDTRIEEFEEILQRMASDIASGALFEKLSPSEFLEKTENSVNRLSCLASNSEELMLILKPEKTQTTRLKCANLTQTLTTFKNILVQNTADPPANSRLAFEQLKKAVGDGSEFLVLMKDVRDNPSPLISPVLAFKKASETKSQLISIKAPEDVQPAIKHVLNRMDEFKATLTNLERKVSDLKQSMQELQEESLKILSSQGSPQSKPDENKTENRQLSLSNFKAEQN